MSKGIQRREFLKVLGVTGAGTSLLAGCHPNGTDKLIPYVIPHEDIVPGLATWYHTTCRECPAGCGMSIRTREGRAVKAEGNALSPISHGKLCARGQASLHGLYDPDRIPQALAKSGDGWDKITWDDAEQRVYNAVAANRGRTVFLTHTFTGTLDRLIDDWCTAMGVQRVRYDAFAWEALRAGYASVLGGDAVPVHDFSNADVVVTFGADFMETWVSPVDYANGFVKSHSYTAGRRGKLISVTPHQSLTDMNADEWLNIRPGTEHIAALAIARLVAGSAGGSVGAHGAVLNSPAVEVNQAAETCGVTADRLRAIARDFARNGRSLAVGPGVSSSHRAATAVGAAVAILNQVAGNVGKTVKVGRNEEFTRAGSYRDAQDVFARMRNGQVTALLVYGPNPVYSMPESGAVKDALKKAQFVASFNSYIDETTELAHVLLPDHHFLESWGDYVPRTGMTSLIQPVMTTVFQTKQTADVLLSLAQRARVQLPNAAATYYDYLKARWTREILPGSDAPTGAVEEGAQMDAWSEALKAGHVQSATPAAAPAPSSAPALPIDWAVPTFSGDGDYTLLLYPSLKFYDGRLANRPWLQELPDPVSKFTWASFIEISPNTANKFGLDTGHIAKLRTNAGVTDELPIFVHPGMRDDVIALQLGQGHKGFGRYAQDRGANGFALLQAEAEAASGGLVFQQVKVKLEPTGHWEKPTSHSLHDEQGNREIAKTMTLSSARDADIKKGFLVASAAGAAPVATTHARVVPNEQGGQEENVDPMHARVHQLQSAGGMTPSEVDASPQGYPHIGMHYGEYTDVAPRWGMVIDLEKCIGCSACVTACYAENNIGIVGPEQISMGRIMHWIRIERYFEFDSEKKLGEAHSNVDPGELRAGQQLKQTRFVPMTCQQCGNAPCEPVCPVYAAYHTPDGLNAQVYNRCVGTRYCSNNCPYKVRVFNWFSWEWPAPLNWQLNPDVTVREKAVMEKCTFCVQRIRDAQNHARVEDRAVNDGEITPACAQTCPGDAIVFGNIKDPNSRVARAAASGRGYRVFEDLNTQSAITYLKKVELDG